MTSRPPIIPPLRVLIVEDNPMDADLVLFALRRAGHTPASSVRVDTRGGFLEELAMGPDIILCDYNLPRFGAKEALELVKTQGVDVPVIIISGSIGEETAVELIKLGAVDYLLKDRLGRLGPAIELALEQKRLRAEGRRVEEELRESEFKYRCLFDHLLDAAYLCDAATRRIIDTNIRGERLLGRTRAAILGLHLDELLPADALERLRALTPETSDETATFTTEIAGAGQDTVSVQVSAASMVIHHHKLLLVLVRNLGESPSV